MSLVDGPEVRIGNRPNALPKTARFVRIDKRTRQWKRRAELVRQFQQALGASIDDAMNNRIIAAAETRVISEMVRAAYMRGNTTVSLEDLVRIENQAARAERALALPKPGVKPQPTLRDYLAAKAAEKAAGP